jgi:hypothetical protein
MNQQVQPENVDQLLQALSTLCEEALKRDIPRLQGLLKNGELKEPGLLASEMVQTVVAINADFMGLATRLILEHQQGIVELEDTTYQDFPRAVSILVGALRKKEILTEADAKSIGGLVGEGSDQDSVLSAPDAEMLMSVLLSYQTLATQMASSKENEEEATKAQQSLEAINAAIARVTEISVPPEPDEDEGEDDEDDEDEDDEDSQAE